MGYLYAKKNFEVRPDFRLGEQERERIMVLMRERGELTNDDIEKMFGVSDATATRYLDKLEKEGKIIQIGREGRFVKYKIK